MSAVESKAPAARHMQEPPATKFLEVPGGTIAYDDAGSGRVVICVPSIGDLRAEYRFLRPQLLAAGFRVVTMDIRGHGESSAGFPDYSSPASGSDILALARHPTSSADRCWRSCRSWGRHLGAKEGVEREGVLGQGGVDAVLEHGADLGEGHAGAGELALVAQISGWDPDGGKGTQVE